MEPNFKLQEAFLDFLLDRDILSEEDLIAALDRRRELTPPIGKIALQMRILTVKQVNRILMAQCDTGLRFGDQAVELGYLEPENVQGLLQMQVAQRPTAITALQDLGLLDSDQLAVLRDDFLKTALSLFS